MKDKPVENVVTILGKTWPVQLPGFAEREELATGFFRATAVLETNPQLTLRVAAAALGFCCPAIGQAAGASYARCGYDLFAFGGRVYDFLRRGGAEQKEVGETGGRMISLCTADLFPREPEVAEAADFTGAPEAAPS